MEVHCLKLDVLKFNVELSSSGFSGDDCSGIKWPIAPVSVRADWPLICLNAVRSLSRSLALALALLFSHSLALPPFANHVKRCINRHRGSSHVTSPRYQPS